MKVEYFKEYSECLQREMEYKVYGHAGIPLLVFPAQDGHFYDFEAFGMVDSVYQYLENGQIQLFCVDSIDQESWSDTNGDIRHRLYMHEQWYYYIINELVPRIFEINAYANGHFASGIITTGCSLGASHAANFMFRRPDIFKGCIALSGYYDSDLFLGGYHDDIVYRNWPIQYLHGMANDHPYIEEYRQCKIILCCGQGDFEEEMIRSTKRMEELLHYKNIPAWVDYWGQEVKHDWDWWRVQFPYFIKHIV